MFRNLHKCIDMSVQLHICIYMYIHGIYMFTIVCTGINMCIHGIDVYIPLCQILSIWSGFQMLHTPWHTPLHYITCNNTWITFRLHGLLHSHYTLYYMACYTVNYMDHYIELHSSNMLITLPITSPVTQLITWPIT